MFGAQGEGGRRGRGIIERSAQWSRPGNTRKEEERWRRRRGNYSKCPAALSPSPPVSGGVYLQG